LSDQNFSIRLSNTRKHRINVYLEPWGEVYLLEPNKNYESMLLVQSACPRTTLTKSGLERVRSGSRIATTLEKTVPALPLAQ
jgi:hypothetical protein